MAHVRHNLKRFLLPVLFILFILSMGLGQLVSVSPGNGVYIYAHDVLLALVLVAGYATVMRRKLKVQPLLMQPIIIFIVAGVISLVVNLPRFGVRGILASSLYLIRWIMYADLYVLLSQPVVSRDLISWGIYALGTTLSCMGLVQFFLYPDLRFLSYLGWDPHYYRLFSTFFDPNFAGMFICLTIIFGIWLYEQHKRFWIPITLAINGIALYLTYSRSTYLAVIAGLTVWVVWHKHWKLGIGIALLVIMLLFIPRPGGNTLSLFRRDSSLARIGNWQESIPIIAASPVVGNGFDSLRLLHDRKSVPIPGQVVSRAAGGLDSSLLFVLATTGVVGFIAYGWIVVTAVQLYARKTWLVTGVIAALLTHSLFINSLFYAWIMLWFWMMASVAERIYIRK